MELHPGGRRTHTQTGVAACLALAALLLSVLVATPADAASPPGAPSVTVSSGDGALVVSWQAAPAHGAAVTSYELTSRRYLVSTGRWSSWRVALVSGSARTRRVTYANGSTVQVRVRARNRLGWGPRSVAVRGIVGLPGVVPGTRAVPGFASVTVSWSAAPENGTAISAYRVYSRSYVDGGWTGWTSRTQPATSRSVTITSLVGGRPHQFHVRAVNRQGIGPEGAVVSARPQAMPAPTGLVATAQDGQVALTWEPVTVDDLAGYHVYRATSASGPWTKVTTGGVRLTPELVVTGLTNGQPVHLAVTSVDTRGAESARSAPVSATPVDGVGPPIPPGLVATPGVISVTLTWDAVVATDLYGYRVYQASSATGPWTQVPGGVTAAPYTTRTISPLLAGTTYYFRITSVDILGNASAASATVSAVPLSPPDTQPPGAPWGLTAAPGDTQAALSWLAVSDPDLAGYRLEMATNSVGPFSVVGGDVLKPATTATVTGLTNATTYWFRVRAFDTTGNQSGARAPVPVTPVAPDLTPPAPVTSLDAAPLGTAVGLSWVNPVDPDFAGVVIRRATGPTAPSGPDDGDAVGTTLAGVTSFSDVTVTPDTVYSYAVFTRDTAGNHSSAVTVTIDSGAISGGTSGLAVGDRHACALTAGGGVKCWGSNDAGQVGRGTATTGAAAPGAVVGLESGVVSLSAGRDFSCALKATGAVVCWGARLADTGTLGDGVIGPTQTYSAVPVPVVGLGSGVVAISGRDTTTCALRNTGAVLCWGDWAGHIIDWTTQDRSVPLVMTGFEGPVSAISVGEWHACAILVGGAAECWGVNAYGELGNTGIGGPNPTYVTGLGGVVSISAGNFVTCAVTVGGSATCWGRGEEGALGTGDTASSSTPVGVLGLSSGVSKVAVGKFNACALTTAGASWCWGPNSAGQLGNGTKVPSTSPVPVSGLGAGSTRIVPTIGFRTVCAVTETATAVCWGDNTGYLLGNPNADDQSTVPVEVVGLG